MKRLILAGLGLAVFAAATRGAEEVFSKAVRPEDFSATGLGKLTAEELARLDALVRDFKSGALDAAKRQAAAAAVAQAAAEAKVARAEAETRAAKAESAEQKKSAPSLIAKAKVMLTPGTQVEYEPVESRIAGDFLGWEGNTVFTLENGQRWRVLNGTNYNTPAIAGPKVKIAPSSFGAFWMSIEGVSQRVKVAPLAVK